MADLAPQEFILWLADQIKARGWTIRETARRAEISHSSISYTLGGERPSFDTCLALARVFEMAPVCVLTLAGLLPHADDDVTFEDWKYVLAQLSERDRLELLEFARLKLKLQQAERTRLEQPARPVEGPAV